MAFKSSSYSIRILDADKQRTSSSKDRLLSKHGADVKRVISEAKEYSETRKKVLKQIDKHMTKKR